MGTTQSIRNIRVGNANVNQNGNKISTLCLSVALELMFLYIVISETVSVRFLSKGINTVLYAL
jgi:hypothetical protein